MFFLPKRKQHFSQSLGGFVKSSHGNGWVAMTDRQTGLAWYFLK